MTIQANFMGKGQGYPGYPGSAQAVCVQPRRGCVPRSIRNPPKEVPSTPGGGIGARISARFLSGHRTFPVGEEQQMPCGRHLLFLFREAIVHKIPDPGYLKNGTLGYLA